MQIGRDCWLGFGAVVMKGVKVGDEAILAAGAIAVSDIRPRTIVAGIPAREVRPLDDPPPGLLGRVFGRG